MPFLAYSSAGAQAAPTRHRNIIKAALRRLNTVMVDA